MPVNLDAHCAHCASEIVDLSDHGQRRDKDLENRLNDALGVLQQDGFYAFYLFLKYRELDRNPKDVWSKVKILLRKDAVGAPLPQGDDEAAVIEMTEDLQKLLLARQLTERTLVYARYGLRSLPGG